MDKEITELIINILAIVLVFADIQFARLSQIQYSKLIWSRIKQIEDKLGICIMEVSDIETLAKNLENSEDKNSQELKSVFEPIKDWDSKRNFCSLRILFDGIMFIVFIWFLTR